MSRSSTPIGDAAVEPWSQSARLVWAQAWPTALTMLSYTLMQFVDSLMVSHLGPTALAAQGNGGIWNFAPLAFLFGALSVVNAFVAQSLGAGDHRGLARRAWAGVWFALLAWLLVMVPWTLLLPWIFAQMGHEEELLRQETQYAQILSAGSFLSLGSKAMSNVFFGLHRPRVITLAALAGNIVNGTVSYVLIFGERGLPAWGLPGVPGLPALGVAGAALGTLCGVAVELILPLSLFLGRTLDERWGLRRAWRFPGPEVLQLLKVGGPASIQIGNEIVCWAIFTTVLVGSFGTMHITAGWAVLRYMHLSFMPAAGFSVAATSVLGRSIGEGRPDLGRRRVRTAVIIATGYMGACAALMALFRSSLVGVFVSGDAAAEAATVVEIGSNMMLCAAVFQVFDAIGMVYIGGLRGAGDTLVPGIVTLVLAWGLIVVGGWALVRFVPEWGSLGPWMAASAYIIVLGVAMAIRFERGAWLRRRALVPPGPRAVAVATAAAGETASLADGGP